MATKYKDSGIPWIGEIPEGWEIYRIKYNTFLKGRIGWQGLNSSDFIDEGYCLITGTDFDNKGGIHWDTCYRISKERFDEDELLHVKNGDLLMTKDGTIGKMAYINDLQEEASLNSHLLIIRQITPMIDNHFLYWVMLSDVFKGFCMIYQSGSIMNSISQNTLGLFFCSCPPLPTQQRIADFLDRKCAEIDELAALQETMIAELKRYKQSVITEAVTKGLDLNAAMKDSGVEWIGEIPEGWELKRLKFVANRRNEKADDTTLKYIGLEHIVGFSKEMVETENVYDNEGANMCYDRDVIFGKLRPYLGKAKVIEDTCCCSSEFLVLCNVHCPDYLRYLMLSGWFIEIVNASTYGTKMPRANADFIMNMLIPVPRATEQQQIADYLDRKCAEIDELIAIKQQKIEALKEYKKSVIFEYVTGKKEVEL